MLPDVVSEPLRFLELLVEFLTTLGKETSLAINVI
jgi:hypothetical protein